MSIVNQGSFNEVFTMKNYLIKVKVKQRMASLDDIQRELDKEVRHTCILRRMKNEKETWKEVMEESIKEVMKIKDSTKRLQNKIIELEHENNEHEREKVS